MYDQLQIIERAERSLSECRIFKKQIEQMRPTLMAGTLQCRHLDGEAKIYYNTTHNGKRTRVTIDPNWEGAQDLIDDLARKAILEKASVIIEEDIAVLESMMRRFRSYDPLSILRDLGEAYSLNPVNISSTFMDGDIDPAAWKREAYEKNPYHPERLKHPTKAGEMVRSKSEAIIYEALTERGANFRYECRLDLRMRDYYGRLVGQRTVYPDFMILRKSDRRVIMFEHFGKMDDLKYVKKTMRKINDYIASGFHLGENLFMTWETLDIPFTPLAAEETLDLYFGKAEKK
jgi:hypothetical protein